ncbi:flagellar motor protein [Dactylosporangium sp. CA-052675]|uniref:flagellar motor protein n=1 Tax=Dactylosporangium sp. CA-052675 TaxID=3239927 RepID=UPI003D935768
MDPATLAGIVLAFVAIFAAMILEGGSPGSIFLVAPLVLVFVGTLGAAMAGGMLKDTIGLVDSLKRVLLSKSAVYDSLVEDIVKLAEKARREGLLALEDAMKEVQDPFLKKGLQLAIDGTDSEELAAILEAEVDAKKKADKQAAAIFTAMGGYAPTIGIIGTVIGLIHVLENLSQPEKLGHLIAGAFVATLWGVLSANVMWLPMGAKMKRLSDIECGQMELVIAGIINIQAGANPRLVAQKLRSLLPPGASKEKEKAA